MVKGIPKHSFFIWPRPLQRNRVACSLNIRAVSAKSSEFTAAGEEITKDYKKMFDILKKAPHFEFAGVEFFGNDISRNQGAKLTKNLIEKVTK